MPNTKNTTLLFCSGRRLLLAIGLGILFIAAPQSRAEDKKADTSKAEAPAPSVARKLVHKIEPVYPQDLKRRNIGGTVKLDLRISANGNVEKVAIVGGNPILADSAAHAVKQWQYAPFSGTTSMLLNVDFNPNH